MEEQLKFLEWLDVKINPAIRKFMDKDVEELKLERATLNITSVEELKEILGDEFPSYNSEFENSSNPESIIVISGYSPIRLKDIKLFYYESEKYNFGESDLVYRQLREYNYKDELVKIQESKIENFGRITDMDSGFVSYDYDEYGIRRYARIEDPYDLDKYLVYDEEGDKEFEVTSLYVEQLIKDGNKEYSIIDGYIEPSDNNEYGYIWSNKKEIKRAVKGNISAEEKQQIIDNLDENRKAEIEKTFKMTEALRLITEDEDVMDFEEYEEDYLEPPIYDILQEHISKLRESGNKEKYIENLLRHATRECDLRKKNEQAKDLLSEYEKQVNKDGQTQSDD